MFGQQVAIEGRADGQPSAGSGVCGCCRALARRLARRETGFLSDRCFEAS